MAAHRGASAGNALTITLVVALIVVLLGALGYAFFQNFTSKTDAPAVQQPAEAAVEYKTYTLYPFDYTFEYPSTWVVGDSRFSDGTDSGRYATVTITTDNGQTVNLTAGITGIGGYCETAIDYEVIDTSLSSVTSEKPTHFSLLTKPFEGGVDSYIGLTDTYTENKVYQACKDYVYYLYSPGTIDGLNSFYATRTFTNIDEAKAYVQSDEYQAIKRMINSLKQ